MYSPTVRYLDDFPIYRQISGKRFKIMSVCNNGIKRNSYIHVRMVMTLSFLSVTDGENAFGDLSDEIGNRYNKNMDIGTLQGNSRRGTSTITDEIWNICTAEPEMNYLQRTITSKDDIAA